jgi:peptide/nickel transport system permease protein
LNSTVDEKINENRYSNIGDTIKTEFTELGHYFLGRLKSPFTIIGLVIIVFAILVSIFPQILTPYTLADANGVYPDAWSPPSLDHPLGQTKFGRDLLVRIIYGIADSLTFSTLAVLIGIAGALIIGVPLILLNKRLNLSAEVVFFPIFIVPLIVISMVTVFILPPIPLVFGLYLSPFFIYLTAKERFSLYSIGKKLITYIPSFIGFTILFYVFIGVLGFSSPFTIQLGSDIAEARPYFYVAPWAIIFPGIAIVILLLGFLITYAGLQKPPKEVQELKRAL